MRRERPVLVELRAVDLILQIAGRERPCGFRCALDTDRRGLPTLPIERIAHAVACAEIVRGIKPDHIRRVLVCSMTTIRGEPAYSRRGIAKLMGVSEKTITRWLSDGLNQVEKEFEARVSRERFTGGENARLYQFARDGEKPLRTVPNAGTPLSG